MPSASIYHDVGIQGPGLGPGRSQRIDVQMNSPSVPIIVPLHNRMAVVDIGRIDPCFNSKTVGSGTNVQGSACRDTNIGIRIIEKESLSDFAGAKTKAP